MILDLAYCYLWLFSLHINIKTSKNSCLNVRLASDHLYGELLLTWLSLVMSRMVSFVMSFCPRDVLNKILDLIESVSESFSIHFRTLGPDAPRGLIIPAAVRRLTVRSS